MEVSLPMLLATVTMISAQTKMVILDPESKAIHRVEVSATSGEYASTSFHVPIREDAFIVDMDYDFLNDRLYFIKGYDTVMSVFVNGTDLRTEKELDNIGSAIAVDPYTRLMFLGLKTMIGMMDMDGSSYVSPVLWTSFTVTGLAVDYQNELLYYDYYFSESVWRTNYIGVREQLGETFVTWFPHAVDATHNVVYGRIGEDMCKLDIPNEDFSDQTVLGSTSEASRIVYDPHTDRIFVLSPGERVVIDSPDGTRIGEMQDFTGNELIIRVNPQILTE